MSQCKICHEELKGPGCYAKHMKEKHPAQLKKQLKKMRAGRLITKPVVMNEEVVKEQPPVVNIIPPVVQIEVTPQRKNSKVKRILLIASGIALICIAGLIGMVWYNLQSNYFVLSGCLLCLGGGVFLIARQARHPKQKEESATEIITEELPAKHKKAFNITRKQIMLILGGVLALAIGFYLGSLYLKDPKNNTLLGGIAVFFFAGGGYLIYTQLSFDHDRAVNLAKPKYTGKENCLNIYAEKDDKGRILPDTMMVVFETIGAEEIRTLGGQPHEVINTGKPYYINWWNPDTKKLEPFIPPDGTYCDPALLARYMELPATRRYLRHRDSIIKYVNVAVLGLAVGGGFIAIIALAGG